MATLEDHVVCAPLQAWLPAWLRDHAGEHGWAVVGATSAPRALRSLVREPGDTARGDALVIVSSLHADLDADALARVRPGGSFVEIALVRRAGLGDLLRPWSFAKGCSERAIDRVRAWAGAGAFAIEQFVALSPVDAVVTLGRRRQ